MCERATEHIFLFIYFTGQHKFCWDTNMKRSLLSLDAASRSSSTSAAGDRLKPFTAEHEGSIDNQVVLLFSLSLVITAFTASQGSDMGAFVMLPTSLQSRNKRRRCYFCFSDRLFVWVLTKTWREDWKQIPLVRLRWTALHTLQV